LTNIGVLGRAGVETTDAARIRGVVWADGLERLANGRVMGGDGVCDRRVVKRRQALRWTIEPRILEYCCREGGAGLAPTPSVGNACRDIRLFFGSTMQAAFSAQLTASENLGRTKPERRPPAFLAHPQRCSTHAHAACTCAPQALLLLPLSTHPIPLATETHHNSITAA
jgi:hypothetical protein